MAIGQPRVEFDILSTASNKSIYTINISRKLSTASTTTWKTIANLAGQTTHYIDLLPNDGISRDYRARNARVGYTASAWTATISAQPAQ